VLLYIKEHAGFCKINIIKKLTDKYSEITLVKNDSLSDKHYFKSFFKKKILFNNKMPVLFTGLLASTIMSCAITSTEVTAAVNIEDSKNYTYMYYENGYPTRLSARRGSESDANTSARSNPDVVFQTGYFSMMFDSDDLKIKGWNRLVGSDYMTALSDDVATFTPATLNLYAYIGNTRYKAIASAVQGTNGENFVRVIESGQFKKRIDHINVQFQHPTDGTVLTEKASLEITVWSDRVVFNLDCADIPGVTRTTVQFFDPTNKQYIKDNSSNQSSLTISPVDAPVLSTNSALNYISSAARKSDGLALNRYFDEETNALVIDIPKQKVSYPTDKERLDEYAFTVTNPATTAVNLPLVFDEQQSNGAITGTSMTLVSDVNGSPLGHNVQISKNWHNTAQDKFMGPWLRGSTMVKLAPGETKTYRLRVIQGYWAQTPAAHHVQLSVIGWPSQGINKGSWKWDQAALGSWGESITYDPTMHLADTFINDYRPSFTTPKNGSAGHGWAENVGGGSFLIYRDKNDNFRHLKKIKTAYKWNGPNLTEVHYTGITDDDKMRVTYITRLGSTFDYNRNFHSFRYEFLEDVVEPKRLVFYQMAGDYYKTARYSNYHHGTAAGLSATVTDAGVTGYNGKIAFNDAWLSIEDSHGDNGNTPAKANRGFIVKNTLLNGADFDVFLHKYRSSWGNKQTLFDLSSADISRSYKAGDVIEGDLELLLPAKSTNSYWGSDSEFSNRLSGYNQAWQAVYDEVKYNNFNVTVAKGSLVNNYPVEIEATNEKMVADFTIDSGGLGHVPVIIKNVAAGHYLRVQRYIGNSWVWLEGVNLTSNQNYYQGTLNSNGTMDYVFSVKRLESDLNKSWRIRVIRYPN